MSVVEKSGGLFELKEAGLQKERERPRQLLLQQRKAVAVDQVGGLLAA